MKSFLKNWKARLLLVLAIIGPGFITANVDNDAGGIFTYSQAGAQFGYTLLWTMIPITIALIVVQEMAARLGAVTGKGLSDLIREEFGFRLTFIVMVTLVITNYGNIVAEFAGIASSLQLFGWSKYVVVRLRPSLWIVTGNEHTVPAAKWNVLSTFTSVTEGLTAPAVAAVAAAASVAAANASSFVFISNLPSSCSVAGFDARARALGGGKADSRDAIW